MEQTWSGSYPARRSSLSISSRRSHHTHNETESESVSEAGDIGDRALPSRRYSESGSFRLSFDHRLENEIVSSISEDPKLHPPHPAFSSVTPLPPHTISPLSTYAAVGSEDSKQVSSYDA